MNAKNVQNNFRTTAIFFNTIVHLQFNRTAALKRYIQTKRNFNKTLPNSKKIEVKHYRQTQRSQHNITHEKISTKHLKKTSFHLNIKNILNNTITIIIQ